MRTVLSFVVDDAVHERGRRRGIARAAFGSARTRHRLARGRGVHPLRDRRLSDVARRLRSRNSDSCARRSRSRARSSISSGRPASLRIARRDLARSARTGRRLRASRSGARHRAPPRLARLDPLDRRSARDRPGTRGRSMSAAFELLESASRVAGGDAAARQGPRALTSPSANDSSGSLAPRSRWLTASRRKHSRSSTRGLRASGLANAAHPSACHVCTLVRARGAHRARPRTRTPTRLSTRRGAAASSARRTADALAHRGGRRPPATVRSGNASRLGRRSTTARFIADELATRRSPMRNCARSFLAVPAIARSHPGPPPSAMRVGKGRVRRPHQARARRRRARRAGKGESRHRSRRSASASEPSRATSRARWRSSISRRERSSRRGRSNKGSLPRRVPRSQALIRHRTRRAESPRTRT